MRDHQQQLADLEKVVTRGMLRIRRRRLLKYGYPIVLEGEEGVILRDLLELICAGDKDKTYFTVAGRTFFEKSPVFCEREIPLPGLGDNPVSGI